jgi:hypothetical protein
MKTMISILLASSAIATLDTCNAATITQYPPDKDGHLFIDINGIIDVGDDKKFDTVMDSIGSKTANPVIRLSSPGGRFTPGLNIAKRIAGERYATFVPKDAACGSVCAIIWISGSPRVIEPGGSVGFHQIFDENTKQTIGAPNAVLGAYLGGVLRLNYEAIAWITEKGADEINWLTPSIAKKLEISVDTVASLPKTYPFEFHPTPSWAASAWSPSWPVLVGGRNMSGWGEEWGQPNPPQMPWPTLVRTIPKNRPAPHLRQK